MDGLEGEQEVFVIDSLVDWELVEVVLDGVIEW